MRPRFHHQPRSLSPRRGRGMQPGAGAGRRRRTADAPGKVGHCISRPEGAGESDLAQTAILRLLGSTLTNILFHIIFSTKHREPSIDKSFRARLFAYMGGIVRDEGGV